MQVDEFFEVRYADLRRYCRAKWDGMGEDVLHEAYVIAIERYKHINFSLFTFLCTEAAREVEMYRYGHDENGTIIMPPTAKAAERLMLQVEDEDEHVKRLTRIAKKMAREHRTGQMCLFLFSKEVR